MAAEPTLASTTFENALKTDVSEATKRGTTSRSAIDDALCGGFDFGRISCISGDPDGARSIISLYFIANHLLSSLQAHVAVIDPVGSFDVLKLHQILSSHVALDKSSGSNATRIDDLEGVLERVKLMRIFDFVGLNEAINELRGGLEHGVKADGPASPIQQPTRSYVPDSEDEEDKMLLDPSPQKPSRQIQKAEERAGVESLPSKSWMLLIDNFAHAMNPILKTNYIQGQALMATFFRSLTHLTHNHNICTIITNNVLTAKPKGNRGSFELTGDLMRIENAGQSESQSIVEQPSIFASNTLRPALGKTFAGCMDLHVMLSTLPVKKRDAQMLYGSHPDQVQRRASMAYVLEVLTDRWDGRVGRWAAFRVDGLMLKGIA